MGIAFQVFALLLFSQLVAQAHGIRLEKESRFAFTKHIHPEKLENQEGKSANEKVLLHKSGGKSANEKELLHKSGRKSANEKELLHESGEKCRGATKESTVRKSGKSHDSMIPSFHEDYYGPRDHKPKHH